MWFKQGSFINSHAQQSYVLSELYKGVFPAHTELDEAVKPSRRLKYAYIILGGGSIGLAIAKELSRSKKEFLIVDADHARVEALRDQDYEAVEGDIGSTRMLKELPLKGTEGIFILSSNFNSNMKALEYIKKASPDSFIMARAIDLLTVDELYAAGADVVLHPPTIVAGTALSELQRAEMRGAAWQLMSYLKSLDPSQRIGIVVHDNPDPDAFASALALKDMAESFGKVADILYYGMIGHQETRAFVNLLNIPLRQVTGNLLSEYGVLALVDSNLPGKNNSLAKGTQVNIIIDHHPLAEGVEVKAGEPLFAFDSSLQEAELDRAQTNVQQARAKLESAKAAADEHQKKIGLQEKVVPGLREELEKKRDPEVFYHGMIAMVKKIE